MSDIADLAAAREQELRDDALAAHRRRLARASRPTADWPALTEVVGGDDATAPTRCALCEEPIPAARRQAVPGCDTCIDCQEETERAIDGAPRERRGRRGS